MAERRARVDDEGLLLRPELTPERTKARLVVQARLDQALAPRSGEPAAPQGATSNLSASPARSQRT